MVADFLIVEYKLLNPHANKCLSYSLSIRKSVFMYKNLYTWP